MSFKYVYRWADKLGGRSDASIEEVDALEDRDLQLEAYLENRQAVTPRLLEKQVFAVAANTTTFSNIPSWVQSLELRWSVQQGVASAGTQGLSIRFNGDVGNNYWRQYVVDGVRTQLIGTSSLVAGFIARDQVGRQAWGEARFVDVQNTATARVGMTSHAGYVAAADLVEVVGNGIWTGTGPVTSVTFLTGNAENLQAGSTLWLYGYP